MEQSSNEHNSFYNKTFEASLQPPSDSGYEAVELVSAKMITQLYDAVATLMAQVSSDSYEAYTFDSFDDELGVSSVSLQRSNDRLPGVYTIDVRHTPRGATGVVESYRISYLGTLIAGSVIGGLCEYDDIYFQNEAKTMSEAQIALRALIPFGIDIHSETEKINQLELETIPDPVEMYNAQEAIDTSGFDDEQIRDQYYYSYISPINAAMIQQRLTPVGELSDEEYSAFTAYSKSVTQYLDSRRHIYLTKDRADERLKRSLDDLKRNHLYNERVGSEAVQQLMSYIDVMIQQQ